MFKYIDLFIYNMTDPKVPVVCRSCGNKVTLDQVKFDDIRKAYVCTPCFKASHNSSSDKPEVSPIVASMPSNDRVNYICASCKYKFSAKKNKPPKRCPYCGYEELEVRDESAKKIIDESDEFE